MATAVVTGKGNVKTVVKEKKGKRTKHPLVGAKTGYPFTAIPTDFNYDHHRPLQAKDFNKDNRDQFFEFRAIICQRQADAMKKRAQEEREMEKGGSDTKKLMRQAQKMAELQAILSKKGIDVAAIVARAQKEVGDKLAAAGTPA